DELSAFERHLTTCAACATESRSLSAVADALAYAAPAVAPRPELRARVLSSLRAERPVFLVARRGTSWGWLAAAAMLLVSVSLAGYTVALRGDTQALRQRVRELERQVAEAAQANEATRVRLAVLTAPDLTDVPLAGQAPAPRALGRAFWSRSRGLLFAASALP